MYHNRIACEYCGGYGVTVMGNCTGCGAPPNEKRLANYDPTPQTRHVGYKMVMGCSSAGEPVGPVFEQIDPKEL